ncbi:hypothetical protein [Chryseobacterium phosphatilyticum]|nr:hypothetical protein [Chryseobacterium phosphatilyticum]
MDKKLLSKGKKLSKRELKTIAGGLLNCMQPGTPCEGPLCDPPIVSDDPRDYCTIFSPRCAQIVCRP